VVGFQYQAGGRTAPQQDGVVVCSQFESALLAAWEESQMRAEDKEVCLLLWCINRCLMF
jgi:hypothetical protein